MELEWISPSFVAKLREALPGVDITGRRDVSVREGFDPASFDAEKDLINEDDTLRKASGEAEEPEA